MPEPTNATIEFPATSRDVLTELLRQGAQKMLATAIEAEVQEWLADREHLRNGNGHRQVVRNGRLPKRRLTTGVGQVEIEQPRVRDNTRWGTRKYLDMSRLTEHQAENAPENIWTEIGSVSGTHSVN